MHRQTVFELKEQFKKMCEFVDQEEPDTILNNLERALQDDDDIERDGEVFSFFINALTELGMIPKKTMDHVVKNQLNSARADLFEFSSTLSVIAITPWDAQGFGQPGGSGTPKVSKPAKVWSAIKSVVGKIWNMFNNVLVYIQNAIGLKEWKFGEKAKAGIPPSIELSFEFVFDATAPVPQFSPQPPIP